MSHGRRLEGELCVVVPVPATTAGQWPPPYSPNEGSRSTPLQPLYGPLSMSAPYAGNAPHLYHPALLPYPPPQASYPPGTFPAGAYPHPTMAYHAVSASAAGWHHAAYAMHMQQQGQYFAQQGPSSPEGRQVQQQQWQRNMSPPQQQQQRQPRTQQQQQQQPRRQAHQQRRQQQQQHQRYSSGGPDGSSAEYADALVYITPYSEGNCTPGDSAASNVHDTRDINITSSSNGLCSSDGSCGDSAEVPKRQLTAMIKGAQTVRQLQSLLDVHGSRADYIHVCAMAAKLPKLPGAQPRGHEAHAAGILLDQLLGCLVALLQDCSPRELANVLWACGKMAVVQGVHLRQLAPDSGHSPPVLTQLLDRLMEQLPAAKAQELSNVLWALAKLADSDSVALPAAVPAQLEALLQRLVELVGSAKPQECSNALWALAKVAESGKAALPVCLEGQLEALIAQLVASVEDAKCQEVANALWAAAKLAEAGHFTKPWPALPAQLHTLLSSLQGQLPGAKPQELCNALWALGRLRANGLLAAQALPDGLLVQLVTRLADTDGGKHQELANALWAAAKLAQSPAAVAETSVAAMAVAAPVAPEMQRSLERLLVRYAGHIDVATAADVAAVMWAVVVQSVVGPLAAAAAAPGHTTDSAAGAARGGGDREPGSALGQLERLARRFMHSQLSASAKAADVAYALNALALLGSSSDSSGSSGSNSHWQLGRQLPGDVERCFERLSALAPDTASSPASSAAATAAAAASSPIKAQHLALALHAASLVAAATAAGNAGSSAWVPSKRFVGNVERLVAGSLAGAQKAGVKLLLEAVEALTQHVPALASVGELLQQGQQQQQQQGQQQQEEEEGAAKVAGELAALQV